MTDSDSVVFFAPAVAPDQQRGSILQGHLVPGRPIPHAKSTARRVCHTYCIEHTETCPTIPPSDRRSTFARLVHIRGRHSIVARRSADFVAGCTTFAIKDFAAAATLSQGHVQTGAALSEH